jgi:hypothetical protein
MNYHKKASYAKSLIRIIGYLLLIPYPIFAVGALLVSEILGVAEESDS